MVNDRAKQPSYPIPDKAKQLSSIESIPHRNRKRPISAILSTKDGLTQGPSREESEATRLLTRTPLLSIPTSCTRESESARLVKLLPDLNQKEIRRLVAALIKRQKRDATSTGKRREKSHSRTIPALFTYSQRSKSPRNYCPRRPYTASAKSRCLPEQQLHQSTMHFDRCRRLTLTPIWR